MQYGRGLEANLIIYSGKTGLPDDAAWPVSVHNFVEHRRRAHRACWRA